MHYHAYTSRVPGALANGSPESEPGFTKTSLGEKAAYVPTAGAGDFYRSNHPPRITRRWLLRDPKMIAKTCETADEAADWLAGWVEENPRPDSSYFSGEPQDVQRQRHVDHARDTLANGNDVVSAHYTKGGEYTSASVIACPPRDGKWQCPTGRAS